MPAGADSRAILALAVPAFLALVSEPLFLLADAAVVGHLGTPQLAGLGLAGAVLQGVVGLCIFLAYGTTASVARQIGAGDLRGALVQGIDGVWLAVLIGALATALGIPLSRGLIGIFGGSAATLDAGTTYLHWAFLGTVPLLVNLAATGILRGLQDTRTPLVVAVAGNVLNVGLNVLLVYGVGLGIAGSAIGSVVAQLLAATALVVVVVRAARAHQAPLRPDRRGIGRAAHAGIALVVRTLTLRACLLVMTYAAATGGDRAIATHQIASTLWTFLAFSLDAIAIAAQAITGRFLGAGDADTTRAATSRMVRWGVVSGVATGLGLAALSPALGLLFTTDDAVRDLLVPVLIAAAVFQPLAGLVFVLDGVLIGAGDGRYLAWAGVGVLVVFAPAVLVAAHFGVGLAWLWALFGLLFIGGRAALLARRAAGDAWLVTGASPAGI